jgi:hypothetical protein
MALDVGSRLGHYNVTAKIGEGGMGEVVTVQSGRGSKNAGEDDSERQAAP